MAQIPPPWPTEANVLATTLLQGVAYLLVPLAALYMSEAAFGLPFVAPVLLSVPVLGETMGMATQMGLGNPNPVPMLAAAVSIGAFMLSGHSYTLARAAGGGFPHYLRSFGLAATSVLAPALVVFAFAVFYLRMRLSISLFLSLGTGYLVFKSLLGRQRFRDLQK